MVEQFPPVSVKRVSVKHEVTYNKRASASSMRMRVVFSRAYFTCKCNTQWHFGFTVEMFSFMLMKDRLSVDDVSVKFHLARAAWFALMYN